MREIQDGLREAVGGFKEGYNSAHEADQVAERAVGLLGGLGVHTESVQEQCLKVRELMAEAQRQLGTLTTMLGSGIDQSRELQSKSGELAAHLTTAGGNIATAGIHMTLANPEHQILKDENFRPVNPQGLVDTALMKLLKAQTGAAALEEEGRRHEGMYASGKQAAEDIAQHVAQVGTDVDELTARFAPNRGTVITSQQEAQPARDDVATLAENLKAATGTLESVARYYLL